MLKTLLLKIPFKRPLVGVFTVTLCISFLWLSNPVESANAKPKIWTIYFTNLKKQKVVLYVEIARTEKEKRKGLMFRESLPKNMGMIFLYDKPVYLNFWMRNTAIPLSIAFITEDRVISEIYNMKPYDETFIRSTEKAIYAIEANNGWYRKNLVYHGSSISIVKADERTK
ncbi:MAG: DUF192 domain-containing protein [Leptospirales bacterium]